MDDGFHTGSCAALGQSRKGLGIDGTKTILGGGRKGREEKELFPRRKDGLGG